MKLTIIIYVYVYIASKYVPWSTIVYFLVNVRPPPLIRDYCSNFRRNPDMRWMTIPHNPSRTMSFSDGTGWDTEEGPEFRSLDGWSISQILMILYLLYLVVSWLIDHLYSYCLVRIIIVISTVSFLDGFSHDPLQGWKIPVPFQEFPTWAIFRITWCGTISFG